MESSYVEFSQVKVFKCDFCNYYFRDEATLREHRRNTGHINEASKEWMYTSCIKRSPSLLDIYTCMARNSMQLGPEADIKDENVTNRMNGNVTNQIDKNDVYEKGTNKIGEHNKRRKISKQMYEIEINMTDQFETIKMGEIETINIDETDATYTNEIETDKIGQNKTNEIDEKVACKIDQQYSCNLCNDIFFLESEFDKHWQQHIEHVQSCRVNLSQVELFKCDYCPSYFQNKEKLRVHRKKYYQIHRPTSPDNMVKPFECEECGWRFVKASTLKAHSVLHEPFPHMCECGIGYYQKCDLRSHRLLVHPKPPKPPPPPIKQETKLKSKPSTQLKPHNKLGPRLKATLTFKQPKTKTTKRKSLKGNRSNKTRLNIQRTFKKKGPKAEFEMELDKDENGNYACTICTQTFITINDLMVHLCHDHTEKDGDKYKCKICGRKETNASTLKFHIMHHAGIKPYVCQICNGKYSQTGALKLHMKRHFGDRRFQCKDCDKSFYDAASLRLHARIHTGEKPFICKVCGKGFADPSAHIRHEAIHTGLKLHQCQKCPKSFCDPSALYRHNRTIHQKFRESCPKCDRTFANRASVYMHLKSVHGRLTDEDKYHCDLCAKKFTLKGNLVGHMKVVHLNPTQFECDICHVKCSRKSNLIKHIQLHMNQEQVVCDICHKSFSSTIYLKKHMDTTHLRIARFKCEPCGLSFLYNSTLRSHEKNGHITNIPSSKFSTYECDYCNKPYDSKTALQHHITAIHLRIRCQMCKRVFPTFQRLRRHETEGCKRCEICNMAFPNFKLLQDHHISRHLHRSERQMLECNYCSKQFYLKERLARHIKSHGPADFQCDHCDMAYSTKQGIMIHIWDKHMVSLYCNVCMKRFYREREFLRHKRSGCRSRGGLCEICNKYVKNLRYHLIYHGPKKFTCDLCGDKFRHKYSMVRHALQCK